MCGLSKHAIVCGIMGRVTRGDKLMRAFDGHVRMRMPVGDVLFRYGRGEGRLDLVNNNDNYILGIVDDWHVFLAFTFTMKTYQRRADQDEIFCGKKNK